MGGKRLKLASVSQRSMTSCRCNALIVECVQLFFIQVAETVALADDPKPEMLSENSEFDLVEGIGGYGLVD